MTEYDTDVLVSADWVEDHLAAFQSDDPDYRLVEVNSPESPEEGDFPSRYDEGHVPGAIGLQWDEDLSDQNQRDILKKDEFEDVVGEHGISEDSTVVFYGDGWIPNWFALFAYWEFKYYGHDDVRVLDGGKDYWVDEEYPLTDEVPAFPEQVYDANGPFESIRAYKDDVDKAREAGIPMVDVRSPEEFSGEIIAPEGLQETAQRGGHIPGASNVPVTTNLRDDGRFKRPDELEETYADAGIDGDKSVVTYCRVGERSAIAWFALHELLEFEDVHNYDGSWTEWGNLIRAPIERGEGD
ncbi:sulfurtransferase [Natronobacterium gregoryi]|uniref:Sulfurtransferase n=2 Tax=Natronobacterium gregoryi TaxID=44930 RepID=L0AIU5_NATGS|nr:sulfurtransferase [Natronobacterium gregoryi]AFZ73369.1 rhodanese-related sulfurtransferase [Natronobacterium gregoryi SP2]ELY68565.1 rhodanese [Natronobacterium gregoryi SP2]PLK19650.1 sulfurtransferase [Natronobacterium gregoryi SP2]SFI73871.1 thiosulfate/3-mercaptopyruvate sulfurtransferase [Natronobacterium gregoryi]